jgi:hypothetical protein
MRIIITTTWSQHRLWLTVHTVVGQYRKFCRFFVLPLFPILIFLLPFFPVAVSSVCPFPLALSSYFRFPLPFFPITSPITAVGSAFAWQVWQAIAPTWIQVAKRARFTLCRCCSCFVLCCSHLAVSLGRFIRPTRPSILRWMNTS